MTLPNPTASGAAVLPGLDHDAVRRGREAFEAESRIVIDIEVLRN